jgi:hypothetical protein
MEIHEMQQQGKIFKTQTSEVDMIGKTIPINIVCREE